MIEPSMRFVSWDLSSSNKKSFLGMHSGRLHSFIVEISSPPLARYLPTRTAIQKVGVKPFPDRALVEMRQLQNFSFRITGERSGLWLVTRVDCQATPGAVAMGFRPDPAVPIPHLLYRISHFSFLGLGTERR